MSKPNVFRSISVINKSLMLYQLVCSCMQYRSGSGKTSTKIDLFSSFFSKAYDSTACSISIVKSKTNKYVLYFIESFIKN